MKYTKFKQACIQSRYKWVILAVLFIGILAGCSQTNTRNRPQLAVSKQPTNIADKNNTISNLLNAQFALNHGDFEAAARIYGRLAKQNPDYHVVKRWLQLALAVHDYKAAHEAVSLLSRSGADLSELAQYRVRIALDSGDTDKALKALDAFIRAGDADVWKHVASLLASVPDQARAGWLLEQVAIPSLLPDDPGPWLAMSQLATGFGKNRLARELAETAQQRFACARCDAWAGRLALIAGDTNKAIALYDKAVMQKPGRISIRLDYANVLMQQHNNRRASEVLSRGPQTLATYRIRAALAAEDYDIGRLNRIYGQLQRDSNIDPDTSDYLLGQIAGSMGEKWQAVAWFARVGKDNTHWFQATVQRALLYEQLGRVVRAHALLHEAEDVFNGNQAKVSRANQVDAGIYFRAKQYTQAITAYSRVLALDTENKDALYGRGLAYAQSGDVESAASDLRQLLRIEPTDVSAMNALGYTLADANKNLSEAKKWLKKAYEAQPDNPAIIDSWGWLQFRLGHLEKAGALLSQAWEMEQNEAEIGLHLVKVLWKQGRKKKAQGIFEGIRKKAPDNNKVKAFEIWINP